MQWDGKREGGKENEVSPQKKECNEVRNGRRIRGVGARYGHHYVRQKGP